MKKFITFAIIITTLVSCGNNFEKDFNNSVDNLKMYGEQCINHFGEETEYICQDNIRLMKKGKKISKHFHYQMDSLNVEISKDVEMVIKKSFDNLFKKYGEKKTIEKINEIGNEKHYKPMVFKTKEEYYQNGADALEAAINERITEKLRDCKLELELMNL